MATELKTKEPHIQKLKLLQLKNQTKPKGQPLPVRRVWIRTGPCDPKPGPSYWPQVK